MAYLVARRTREIAIRIALGAVRSRVATLVLGDGLRLVLGGSAAGVLLALAVSRLLTVGQLRLPPPDGWELGGAVVIVLVAGVGACFGPLLRAISVDPADALRVD